jgi:hypothetical protein
MDQHIQTASGQPLDSQQQNGTHPKRMNQNHTAKAVMKLAV